MVKFQLSVLDAGGGSEEFELYAEDDSDLERKIAEQGWIVLRHRKMREKPTRLKSEELVQLCQQLRIILDAGLPVHEALSALADESESRAVKTLCEETAQRVGRGEALSSAFAAAKLDDFFMAMVRTCLLYTSPSPRDRG